MDLRRMEGMEQALVIGASGGIGSALLRALPAQRVIGLSRQHNGLDLLDEASIKCAVARLEGRFDAIIDATGALEIDGMAPEKAIGQINAQTMMRQFAVNAIGPALLLKHLLPRLVRDRRAVFASLSARVGSIGDNRLGGWISYRASKAALNQIIHTASVEMLRTHPHGICVALHPGTVETDLTRKYASRYPTVAPERAAENITRVINGLNVADTGGFFDWRGDRVPW